MKLNENKPKDLLKLDAITSAAPTVNTSAMNALLAGGAKSAAQGVKSLPGKTQSSTARKNTASFAPSPAAPAAPAGPSYMDQLNSLYDQIVGRGPFQYDLNGDLLYRQMADQYTQLGRQAMRDATGTAAGLTGGYGNSYANLVGNQANQAYLTQLNNNIPQLYDRALKAWLNEGADLESRYDYALAHMQAIEELQPQKTSGASASKTASKTSSDGGFWDKVLSQIKSAFPNTTTTPAQQTDYYQALYNERKKK